MDNWIDEQIRQQGAVPLGQRLTLQYRWTVNHYFKVLRSKDGSVWQWYQHAQELEKLAHQLMRLNRVIHEQQQREFKVVGREQEARLPY